jgi:cell division septal protein FtsQ
MFKKTSAVHKKGKIKRRVIDPSKIMLLKQLGVGVAIFSLLGLIVTGLWYGTRVSFLTVTDITVEGGETIPHDVVKKIVTETLQGTYIGIIPRQFAWWYPEDEIIENISQIPRMKDPVITRDSGRSLTIRFSEYEPYALWCAERSSEDCLFIDKTGYAFTAAPKLSGGAFLRYRTLGREMKVGTVMAERRDIDTMEQFVALVEDNLQFSITQIETDTAGDVFYILAGGGEFKATLRDDATQVFDNLRAILSSDEFTDVKPGNFQYIDLRFGNKVFVNEEVGGVGSSTATTTETESPDINKKQIVPATEPPVMRSRPSEEELPV